jgi:hypothetical protein
LPAEFGEMEYKNGGEANVRLKGGEWKRVMLSKKLDVLVDSSKRSLEYPREDEEVLAIQRGLDPGFDGGSHSLATEGWTDCPKAPTFD